MADAKTHGEDEQKDIENDPDDTETDDDSTPADTDEESDEPKKKDAEKVADQQEKKWLDKIKSGEKKLDDMPGNLGWLKKRVAEKLEPEKKSVNEDELSAKVQEALQIERAKEELSYLIDDLRNNADITAEQDAQLKEEYEDYLSEFPNPTVIQQLKALKNARRLVGLKDNSETIKERRRKGMALPPYGEKKRSTVNKDGLTETEKAYVGNLPPGFKA